MVAVVIPLRDRGRRSIFGISGLGFFPLLAAGVVAVGYGAILHHLTLEIGLRPVLIDINRAVPPSLANRVAAVPLRMRLLAVLPMINVITGLVVAAVAGADSLGVAILAAIGVATTISLELTILLSRSILRPLADLQVATDAGRRGRLRRRRPGHHRRRDRRARRLLQRTGPGPARARADPRGLRHLPRRGGRRVHPQRRLLGARRGRPTSRSSSATSRTSPATPPRRRPVRSSPA